MYRSHSLCRLNFTLWITAEGPHRASCCVLLLPAGFDSSVCAPSPQQWQCQSSKFQPVCVGVCWCLTVVFLGFSLVSSDVERLLIVPVSHYSHFFCEVSVQIFLKILDFFLSICKFFICFRCKFLCQICALWLLACLSFLFLLFSLEEQVLILRESDLSFLLNDDCFCVFTRHKTFD